MEALRSSGLANDELSSLHINQMIKSRIFLSEIQKIIVGLRVTVYAERKEEMAARSLKQSRFEERKMIDQESHEIR